jgi:PAS domain S-box-containing protein
MPEFASPHAIGVSLVEQMFESAPNVVFAAKDEALRFIAANDAMVSLCCASQRQSLIGRRSSDFFPKEAQERYEALDRLVLRTGRPVRDVLDLTVRSRGSPVWVVISRYPIDDAATNVRGVACIGRCLMWKGVQSLRAG